MKINGLLLLIFLLVAVIAPSLSQITLEPNPISSSPVIIPTHTMPLRPTTFLVCVITEPSNPPAFETRWMHPNGMTITSSDSQFVLSEGTIGLPSGDVPGTLLLIQMLSYEDAGTYSCEARNASDPTGSWYSGELELQLDVHVQVINDSITVSTSAETVELHCEMVDYIRPDSDLQWLTGGNVIMSGTNRHTITYIDGTPEKAQNGGTNLVSGRVAVLTITNPQVSDSGMYTCRVRGANISTDVQLNIIEGNIQFADSELREISLGPDPVMSQQILSCTVTQPLVDYRWQWRFNGNLFAPGDILQSDGTRTSTIVIPRLSADDTGVYQCLASSLIETSTQIIIMNLAGTLVASVDEVFSQLDQSVNLTCELYGYLGEDSSTVINWQQLEGNSIDSSLIVTEQGTHMIQNGGDSPTPSVRSVLTLQNITNDMFGNYSCTNGDFIQTIELKIDPGISAVIWGVVGSVIAVIIAVLVVLTVVLLCWKRYRMTHVYLDNVVVVHLERNCIPELVRHR